MPLLLTESDVRAVLDLDELRQAMECALASYSEGRVTQPLRTVIEAGSPSAFLGLMPAFIPVPPVLGAKLVTVFGGNIGGASTAASAHDSVRATARQPTRGSNRLRRRLGSARPEPFDSGHPEPGRRMTFAQDELVEGRSLPTHLATILLWDPATGELLAIIDGRYITETRTAAVSAVSAQWLARRSTGSTLAILGSGVQARSHLEALRSVACLTDVRVWSPTARHRAQFADEMRDVISIRAMDTPERAVRGADLIVLATSAREPVVDNRWVADGAHVMAVGACRPDQREMDPALVARARLFVDSRAGAFAEAGDIVLALAEGRISREHVTGELGEVVAGRVAGRTADAEVTIFKSLGMAVEDVAAADLVYRRAREAGRGIVIEL